MGIIKPSKSGKALLFVADRGDTYILPMQVLKEFIERRGRLFVLTRMAMDADEWTFKKSPVYYPKDYTLPKDINTGDLFNKKTRKNVEEEKKYGKDIRI